MCQRFLSRLRFADVLSATKKFDRNIFILRNKDGSTLKVEFTYYPLHNIEDPWDLDGLQVDSFLDLIVNKLCAIADRVEAKDYLDVYFALQKSDHSMEELIRLAERKCEIKGIYHILKSRLLQIPEGVDSLIPPKAGLVPVEPDAIRDFFERSVREMVRKEISHRE